MSYLDDDGIPYVRKSSKTEIAENENRKEKRNVQNIISLNMQQWKVSCAIWNIIRVLYILFFFKTFAGLEPSI